MTRGPVVGVIGGGQLARMAQQAAISLGLELRVLSANLAEGAGLVTPGAVQGEATDPKAVRALVAGCDVLTVEHELVNLPLLAELAAGGPAVWPSPDTLAFAVDKGRLRGLLTELSLPTLDHLVTDRPLRHLPPWDTAPVVKTARGGYDGRGVWFPPDRETALRLVADLTAAGHQVVVERRLQEPVELAVLVARRPDGQTEVYDPVRTFQEDGICVGLEVPAGVPPSVDRAARALARSVVEAVGAVGICAVELLSDGTDLFVSEIAARPHNSGHHTIDACMTSQFENHLRAVLGLPLGPGDLLASGVGMANLLGADPPIDPHGRLSDGFATEPAARIHLYGKRPSPGRKLGHVTVFHPDPHLARERAAAVAAALGGRRVSPREEVWV